MGLFSEELTFCVDGAVASSLGALCLEETAVMTFVWTPVTTNTTGEGKYPAVAPACSYLRNKSGPCISLMLHEVGLTAVSCPRLLGSRCCKVI